MKQLLLLAALVLVVPQTSMVFAFGGAHSGTVLPPPPPPTPPPPPPAPPPPVTRPAPESGPSTGQVKTGAAPAGGGGAAASTPKGTATAGGVAPKIPQGVPTAMAMASSVDLTTWEYWWLYNQEAYLDVKQHIERSATSSGPDATLASARAWDEAGEHLLPELMTALQSEDDHDPRMASLVALARVCDGGVRRRANEVAAVCIARHRDANRPVAEVSVMALGILGSESSAPELCGLLRDSDSARRQLGDRAVPERMRAFAGFALGLLAARTTNEDVRRYAVHTLVQTLCDADEAMPDVHAACSIALGLIPPCTATRADAPAPLESDRPCAGKQAGLSPDFQGAKLELLLGLLRNAKAPAYVRAHLPQSLSRLAGDEGRERVARALLERLGDVTEKAEVVEGCVLALGALGTASASKIDADIRAALTKQCKDGEVQSRCFAAIALAQNAGRGEAGPGVELARAHLIAGIATGRARERTWSALALGVLEHARNAAAADRGDATNAASAKALLDALRDARAPQEIGAFAIGCGLAGVEDATPMLLECLAQVKESRALGYVQLSLGLLDAQGARETLSAMLAESRTCSEKLPQTALALALLEDTMLVPHLLDLLKAGTSQATIGAAASALGAVGDRRAIEPLRALLHDAQATPASHAAAIAALGRICDRDRLPWQHAVSIGLNYRAMTATLSAEDHGGLLDLH